MTLRQLMQKDIDVTLGNNITDYEWSLVGAIKPTERCEELYHDVLDLDVELDECYGTVQIPEGDEKFEDLLLTMLNTLLVRAAGYCSVELYDALFIIL